MINMAKNEFIVKQVVVVKCKPLMDGWECDCDRTPICLVPYCTAQKDYAGRQYEWYAVMPNGRLQCIKETEY